VTDPALPGSVVVTGAGSGIGRAAALAAAERGAAVAALDVDAQRANAVAAEARSAGAPEAIGVACDVRREESVAGAIASSVEGVGELRGLVTCAGIGSGGLVHELPLETWRDVLDTNLTGTFLACKHVLLHMLDHGRGGSIVCASSPWGEVSAPGGATAYSASKGGVSALVRSVALDYAPHGVRVNAIVPGATETPLMWAGLPEDEIAAARARISEQLVVGRLATPEEIAEGIVWLLGDRASYVTGSHLVVDGGLMARASIES
jgi:NAD(P)-dependent dehydrogenase (short-subunit alcohol dehydrogenase family)